MWRTPATDAFAESTRTARSKPSQGTVHGAMAGTADARHPPALAQFPVSAWMARATYTLEMAIPVCEKSRRRASSPRSPEPGLQDQPATAAPLRTLRSKSPAWPSIRAEMFILPRSIVSAESERMERFKRWQEERPQDSRE